MIAHASHARFGSPDVRRLRQAPALRARAADPHAAFIRSSVRGAGSTSITSDFSSDSRTRSRWSRATRRGPMSSWASRGGKFTSFPMECDFRERVPVSLDDRDELEEGSARQAGRRGAVRPGAVSGIAVGSSTWPASTAPRGSDHALKLWTGFPPPPGRAPSSYSSGRRAKREGSTGCARISRPPRTHGASCTWEPRIARNSG